MRAELLPMKGGTVRTLGFRSNILLAIAAAIAIVAALGRPWYARTPAPRAASGTSDLPPQMESFFSGIGRAFSDPHGTTGWAALERADGALAALAIATAALLALSLVP